MNRPFLSPTACVAVLAVAQALAQVTVAGSIDAASIADSEDTRIPQWPVNKMESSVVAEEMPSRDVRVSSAFTTPTLVVRHGFPSETHTITTADGYILSVHRIPNPGKPVVFLQHGLLESSADWVILGPEQSLGFLLYNAGFDVWMGNSRGNTYSRAHKSKNPSSTDFWDFTWHHMGMYDLPASIDYVLEKTQQEDLVYAGHSQGTTSFLVMASMRPEYNKKVKAFFALAPVAFVGDIASLPLHLIAKSVDQAEFLANLLGVGEFLPSNAFINTFTTVLCSQSSILHTICPNILFMFTGFSEDQLMEDKLPDILENVPAGAATKQLVHYGQLINSNKFRQFDYGWLRNLVTYKSMIPPDYPLNKITTPVHLHYADKDILATPKGVQMLLEELTNVAEVRRVPHDTFSHVDFLFGRDVDSLLYNCMISNITTVVNNQE